MANTHARWVLVGGVLESAGEMLLEGSLPLSAACYRTNTSRAGEAKLKSLFNLLQR
jgi:hypothetical protein